MISFHYIFDYCVLLYLGRFSQLEHDSFEHFLGINFDKLVRREIKPPFVPVVTSDTDVTNFDPTFTSEAVQLTPPGKSLGKDEDEVFEGFLAVAKK